MSLHNKPATQNCPVASTEIRAQALQTFKGILERCETSDQPFLVFETVLQVSIMVLARLLIRLYLAARHERLDLKPYLEDDRYRVGAEYAQRDLKTAYGEVTYGRTHLIPRRGGGPGFHPLDVVLVLTHDKLSPWMMQFVARLATRMSFKAASLVCYSALRWAPATETIEQVVLGLGRRAAPFMAQSRPPAGDGEVLVIEVDGKCPPTATEEELAKRRGRRRPRHEQACTCGCQRHRGQEKRRARGPKKRRKKGDKSKNGKEVVVVVMYTLKRSDDGKLHGPINKKVWASFAGRQAAGLWARAQATKRGFGPKTNKTVQIASDGASGYNLEVLFPQAIFTLDVCHVVEKLWSVGRHFHPEGSAALTAWVEELKTLLYDGHAAALVDLLRARLRQVPLHGPGTKGRREALETTINYMAPRLAMMRYAQWKEQDLVIATGQVEGAVRYVVGERMDCAGMRWLQGKGEAILRLRCIELNGDWDRFVTWVQRNNRDHLANRQAIRILTNQPITLEKAA